MESRYRRNVVETPEPMAQIAVVEQDLRGLIESILSAEFGRDSWLGMSGLTPERISKMDQVRIAEDRSRPGVTIDVPPLRYAELFDLKTIIDRHWEHFKVVFRDKKKFDVYFERLAQVRNPQAHSRELLPFERSLIEGMTGELRNVITLHRSTMDVSGEFYPIIESVRDSFGNEWVAGPGLGTIYTGIRLVVGQVVQFHCKGWDPQARRLSWTLDDNRVNGTQFDKGNGSEVRLSATVRESHVGESMAMQISLISSGRYHRYRYDDDSVTFRYAVNPPF